MGPLLFSIYFNDLPPSIRSSVETYADDTTITCSGSSVREIEEQLTTDCEKIYTWMNSNKLKINVQKTHVLTMGTQTRLNSLPKKLEVKLGGIQLEESPAKSEVLLGCKVQANLKWNLHIEMVISKLGKRISGLAHLRYICPLKVKKFVTEGIFNGVITYCLPLFGGRVLV